ncbi:ABC transporter ATP-binding protein [Lactobacillus rizhaonensis]|uniref:ATP-binding cassette domain-containing protein n=1 Tax=Lactobacillus rizhaonensis TaxID=3082863 RepID=UPI0025E3EBCA|nr:ABC transporter ATP-binding protein [uncultured Lactobacillus sp.]MCT6888591.1 ABC transporter ATP-binding protein/permease [Lactobacillus sp.]
MTIKELIKFNPIIFYIVILFYSMNALLNTAASYFLTLSFTAVRRGDIIKFLFYVFLQGTSLLIAYFLSIIGKYFWQKNGYEYLCHIRKELANIYFTGISDDKVSSVQNKMINDLNLLMDNYVEPIRMLVYYIVLLVLTVGVLFTFHWTIFLLSIVISMAQIFLPKIMDKFLEGASSNVSAKNKFYLKTIIDWLSGLIEVKQYFSVSKMLFLLNKSSSKLENAKIKKSSVDNISELLNESIYSISNCLLYLLVGILIKLKITPFGLLASIDDFNWNLFGSMMGIADLLVQIKGTKNLRNQLIILRSQKKVSKINAQMVNKNLPFGLMTKNLTVKFSNNTEISFPDIKIIPGEKVLLTGASGKGKTTLFKVILNEVKPESGKIVYFDKNNNVLEPNYLQIGYMPQEPVIFPTTIANNITMFDDKLDYKINYVLNEVDLKNDIMHLPLGVYSNIDANYKNVSGGQSQKIVLARLLIHKNCFFLIDEGTSAIDRNGALDIMKNLCNLKNTTLIFIGHNMTKEMTGLFDKIICLK